ncbi:hypothetical protein H8B02_22980 [Bradyrhizobium sp. Pear77]|uniref:hypothetical protein n=1 Tax=Bradyrhizobium altum TaxID=1571202 RepID=UPI001E46FF84|nr:hypothetical protein [Bradyrhizobium altum]MCC8956187.1 hypothetical protein [Bradyrhizobium altum]
MNQAQTERVKLPVGRIKSIISSAVARVQREGSWGSYEDRGACLSICEKRGLHIIYITPFQRDWPRPEPIGLDSYGVIIEDEHGTVFAAWWFSDPAGGVLEAYDPGKWEKKLLTKNGTARYKKPRKVAA